MMSILKLHNITKTFGNWNLRFCAISLSFSITVTFPNFLISFSVKKPNPGPISTTDVQFEFARILII